MPEKAVLEFRKIGNCQIYRGLPRNIDLLVTQAGKT